METKLVEVELLVDSANLPVLAEDDRNTIVETLKPLVTDIGSAGQIASQYVCNSLADAETGVELKAGLSKNIKAVEGVLKASKQEAAKRHKAWCSLEAMFLDPFKAAYTSIHQKATQWQLAENERAAAEQRRLQAEADEKARKEAERLEKQAEKLKTPELKEQRLEEAHQVRAAAPVVQVMAPKATGLRMAMVPKVKSLDQEAFFKALATDKSLRGYVEIKMTALERARSANNALEIPGVVYEMRAR